MAVDRDGLRARLPEPVGQHLQVQIQDPVARIAAGRGRVVDDDQHARARDRDVPHHRIEGVDLGLEFPGAAVVAQGGGAERADLAR